MSLVFEERTALRGHPLYWAMMGCLGLALVAVTLTFLTSAHDYGSADAWFAPAATVFVLAAAAVLLSRIELRVHVSPRTVDVRLWPLRPKSYLIGDIHQVVPRVSDPLKQVGGSGWKREWATRGPTVTLVGKDGVELEFRDESVIFVGSLHPMVLAEAIEGERAKLRTSPAAAPAPGTLR